MGRFADQVVLITGSGSGIGRTMAGRFAAEGARTVVADIDFAAAESTAEEILDGGGQAYARHLDVTDPASVDALVNGLRLDLGQVDVLVNNAAVACDTPFEDLTEQEWDRDVGVTAKGSFLCSRAVIGPMAARRSGAIVNIGSVNALTYLGCEAYSAAKAALISLTRSLAVRYGRAGVRVNAVVAGTIRTPAWEARLARDPGLLERLSAWYPMGRIGSPEDVAAATMFLASADAAWITGSVLRVDGGLLAGNMPMTREILGDPGQ